MAKIGEQNYDLARFGQRGLHEIANALYPESNIVLRDHAGLYAATENRDVEASQPNREMTRAEPERVREEPEMER